MLKKEKKKKSNKQTDRGEYNLFGGSKTLII